MSKKNAPLEFMGVPVVDAGNNKFKVTKTDQDKILDGLGVTKEVRKVVANAENEIIKAGIEFTGNAVIAAKKPATITLGSGPTKLAMTMAGKTTGRNLHTGEPTTSFGRFTVRKRGMVPTAFKSAELADMQKAIEKAMK
jgi:hypothetical protein